MRPPLTLPKLKAKAHTTFNTWIRERDKERRQIEIRDLETGSRYDKRKGKNREAREIEKGYQIRK